MIRCDQSLIRHHVVYGFEWHLATSHAWRLNPQTPWRYHRAIGWHKKKQINSCRLWSVWNVTKVRLELVLFVQVSSAFVFNYYICRFHGESPVVFLSIWGWSQSILICQHPLTREWWPYPHSRPSQQRLKEVTPMVNILFKIFGGTGWAHVFTSINRCMVQSL